MPSQIKTFNDIYRGFEDRFRGSREEIKQRLKVYLPLLEIVAPHLRRTAPVFDLGCGRGEWLELLSEYGWQATGIDLNAGMAKVATDIGLSVKIEDAVEFLRIQPDASIAVISAFHLVEHVSIDYLIDLLRECHRVLAETGLLILETPNPENLTVGTWSFYMDPTHNKPLPPLLLEFLVESAGFKDVAIVRLNGIDPADEDGALERIAKILFMSAMDYSIVAQKLALEPSINESNVGSFARAVSQNNPADGPRVAEILRATDRQRDDMKEQLSSFIDDRAAVQSELQQTRHLLLEELSELQEKVAELHNHLAEIEMAHAAERSLLIERASQAEQRAIVVEQSILGSTSWRLTAPLRDLKRGVGSVAAWPKTVARYGLRHAIVWLSGRPRASALARSLVRFVPPLERHFQAFARASSASSGDVDAWTLEPDREILNEWRKLFRRPRS